MVHTYNVDMQCVDEGELKLHSEFKTTLLQEPQFLKQSVSQIAYPSPEYSFT